MWDVGIGYRISDIGIWGWKDTVEHFGCVGDLRGAMLLFSFSKVIGLLLVALYFKKGND